VTHSVLASVAEGARYVAANPTLTWVLVISGTVFTFAGPAGALLPALAGETLFNGVSWLSLLLTSLGAGAFSGALVVMNVGRMRSLGRVFVVAATLNGAMLVFFALSANPLVTLAFGYLTGLTGTLMAGMGNNMLQTTTEDSYRGRVMSVWGFLFIGLMPIGQLALGAIGSVLGIHAALVVGGVISMGAGAYATIRLRALRDWRSRRRHAPQPAQTAAVGQPTFR
jgi:hypothetical protein